MDFSKMTFTEVLNEIIASHKNEKVKKRILASLNLKLIRCDEENRCWAEYLYKKQEKYLNPYDGVHGGIASTLADSCMGTTLCGATQALPSTTDISVSFIRPMIGNAYVIHVDIKTIGKQLASCVCEITDRDTGKLCVQAMGRFILVKKDILADEEASKAMQK